MLARGTPQVQCAGLSGESQRSGDELLSHCRAAAKSQRHETASGRYCVYGESSAGDGGSRIYAGIIGLRDKSAGLARFVRLAIKHVGEAAMQPAFSGCGVVSAVYRFV